MDGCRCECEGRCRHGHEWGLWGTGAGGVVPGSWMKMVQVIGVEALISCEAEDGGGDKVGGCNGHGTDGRGGFVAIGALAGDVGGFG